MKTLSSVQKNFELTPEERYRIRQIESIEKNNITEDMTYGHRCADRAVDFIEKHKDEDYFLVMSLDEPHGPHICPKKYVDLYKDYEIPVKENMKDTLEDKPEHHRIWAGDEYLKACCEDFKLSPKEFLGCNTFADYEIGRVLDAAAQYEEEPIIIYTSDHGDMMYGHSLTGKGPALYEEITHIPLMIKGFGKGVDKNPVSHINLAPTIFDMFGVPIPKMFMFGVPIPKMFEGRSIFEEVKNPEIRCNDYVFMEFGRYEVDHDGFGGYQPLRGAFDGRYKMVINLMTSDELYDLQEDPQEMKNLINEPGYDEIRKRLHEAILDNMYETRDPFRGYYWEDRPWNRITEYKTLINEPGYDEIRKRLHEAILDNMYETRDPFRGYYWEDRPWNRITEYKTWDSRLMTRQRENEEYEPRQLDYGTGLPMTSAVRKKGQSDATSKRK